jgi:alpha-amylase
MQTTQPTPPFAPEIPAKSAINGVMLQAFHWYTPADGQWWQALQDRAPALAQAGFTALWLPPAYKGIGGGIDVGYGVYDMYDLGEFNQQGSVRTKYGTKAQYLAAVAALKAHGVQLYADTVLNHRMGADATEQAEATPYNKGNRLQPAGPTQPISSWTQFTFAGRGGQYSGFKWGHTHFDAVDYNALNADQAGQIWLFKGKQFDDQVALENGNYAYLMGCDVDCQNPEVQQELLNWGLWYLNTTGCDGFRLDAIKHIAAWFFPQWLDAMEKAVGRDLFVVGEYWQQDVGSLTQYLDRVGQRMAVFDVPLHYHFHAASKQGQGYDMRNLLTDTVVQQRPTHAVTFVDNHDSQPLQALESVVEGWFKPLAYAVILLREGGYPCVFLADYDGANYSDKGRDGNTYPITMGSHKALLDVLLHTRRTTAYGPQQEYWDHPNCVGWTRLGNSQHPTALAVLLSNGDHGYKWMHVGKPDTQFIDATGHCTDRITTNADGWGRFICPAGSLSVWVQAG